MALLNYTTTIEPEQTIGEIQRILSRYNVAASASGKTRIYQVVNIRTREMAGELRYRYGCHGYVFYPSRDFFFNAACLEQVVDKLAHLNKKRHVR